MQSLFGGKNFYISTVGLLFLALSRSENKKGEWKRLSKGGYF
jgi:hypothetical protein